MPPRNGGRAKGVAPKAASAAAVATSAPSATMQATGVQSSLPTSYADAAFFGLRTRSGPIYTYWSIHLLLAGAMLALLIFSIFRAYMVRMYSVQEYGYLIHEFDPWFNFRATQYFSDHGWNSFFSWFDYMSWYPLGRPVGSTTYPGLQITAVALHRTLAAVGVPMSLNDVCVLIPAWFGAVATFILALLTHEVSGSMWAASMAAYTFSIIPAHMMRSMAGEFDNECIAVSAMLLTFYLWVRSLRTPGSWPIGIFAGLAYGYMVAAWGGYIFVLNMVAVHAASCVLLDWARNVYSPALVRAYTLFFVVGTAIAVCVPPVGWSPFKSLEQLGALLVLLGLWALHISEIWRRRADVEVQSKKCLRIRANAACVLCAMLVVASMVIAPSGYFGPLSSRVRALFVAHTRTGNPLVDSVAEHRAANSGAYIRYLGMCYPLWGLGVLHLSWMPTNNVRGVLFLVLLSIITHYFCGRMVRLLILTGPPACTASACLVARLAKWSVQQAFWDEEKMPVSVLIEAEEAPVAAKEGGTSKKSASNSSRSASSPAPRDRLLKVVDPIFLLNHTKAAPRFLVVSVLVLLVAVLVVPAVLYFDRESLKMSFAFANPRIVTKARDPQTGQQFVFDDYYQSYLWLRDNTPQDARVLAWWDYGYQITGIGNRTSLADGNTWNHEHIATLGKLLTSPVPEAYSLIRHLADYVLIWANQGGDLGKSPHMARIGNSVYRDICPKDPLCEHFGFFSRDYSQPSPMMRASLLYNLHEHEHTDGVRVSPKQFKEVYTSRYHLVRIFKVMNVSKESKQWLADPANRVCSPPGSWVCPGQYPPAPEIQSMLAKRMDFGQLEDFNRGKKDDAYYAAYMNRMRQR